jgi:hypothetical protein
MLAGAPEIATFGDTPFTFRLTAAVAGCAGKLLELSYAS